MALYTIIIEWKTDCLPETSSLENILNSNFKNQKLTSVSYLIESQNTAVEIRNYLTSNIPSIDRIYIGEMASSAAWRNMVSSTNDIKMMYEDE